MVRDLIKNTKNNLKINKIKSLKDVYKLDEPIVCFSDKFLNTDQLKNDPNRAIADFISGMTDRYAINLNKSI